MAILVTIEGPDFVGKTTQVKLVCDRLEKEGLTVARLSMLPPSGIRTFLLEEGAVSMEQEILLLKAAALAVHSDIEDIVHRSSADVIVMDRGPQTFIAYQGRTPELRGLIGSIERYTGQFHAPDLEVRLWLTADETAGRQYKAASARGGLDRIEEKGLIYQQEVANRFRLGSPHSDYSRAKEVVSLHAEAPPEELASRITTLIISKLKGNNETVS